MKILTHGFALTTITYLTLAVMTNRISLFPTSVKTVQTRHFVYRPTVIHDWPCFEPRCLFFTACGIA